jgi:hypothetical protein
MLFIPNFDHDQERNLLKKKKERVTDIFQAYLVEKQGVSKRKSIRVI